MDFNTIVVGSGTGGATLAGLLAEHGEEDVLLLEAGPDYGPYGSPAWPADMLDARVVPLSHDWGLTEEGLELDLPRAKIIGGCSAHNGCTAAVGAPADWADYPWPLADVEPLLDLVRERFRVRALTLEELTPVQAAFVEAGRAQGLPLAFDLHELTAGVGIGPMAANVLDGVRFNSAFAFLDPVRERLEIRGGVEVERVLVEHGRACGVVAGGQELRAERVVVAGGAYGSPALLLRSGVGPGGAVADLPVGENLLDHPCVALDFTGSERFRAALASTDWHPDEQTVGRARSSLCDDGPYDIHVFLVAGANTGHPDLPPISMYGGAMKARSRGRVTLDDGRPVIDHRYLSDPHDRQVLDEARALLEAMAAESGLASFLGDPAGVRIANYCHPAGTCPMGPVVDGHGQVHGVEGLYVADASVMPTITRGNPNLPTAAIAAKIALGLVREHGRARTRGRA